METWLSVVCLLENASDVFIILMATLEDCYGATFYSLILLVGEILCQQPLPLEATIISRLRLQEGYIIA